MPKPANFGNSPVFLSFFVRKMVYNDEINEGVWHKKEFSCFCGARFAGSAGIGGLFQ
jgi:hypothetical protein